MRLQLRTELQTDMETLVKKLEIHFNTEEMNLQASACRCRVDLLA
jgi:hypothetical protein